MAVRIRLARTGRKKIPTYRVVAADSQMPRDGRFIERLGTYDPKGDPARFTIDEAATLKWLRRGALPTETVLSLLKRSGLWKKFQEEKREKKSVA